MRISYVGHAENWDAVDVDGSLDARDCAVKYKKGGRALAFVTISRDLQSLEAEAAMETEPGSQRQSVARSLRTLPERESWSRPAGGLRDTGSEGTDAQPFA